MRRVKAHPRRAKRTNSADEKGTHSLVRSTWHIHSVGQGTVLALDHDYHIPSNIPEKVTNWSTHDDRHPLTARPVLSSTACSPLPALSLSTPLFGSSGLALYFEYRSFPASGSSSLAQN